MTKEQEKVEIKSRAELRRWLQSNHTQKQSIWLVTWKKPSPNYVSYDDVVEEALCFGWIDSQPRLLDERRSMVRLSPRKPKSAWSAVNKQRVYLLTRAGKMTPAGMAAIELAKNNAMWTALDAAHSGQVPADLESAFARHLGSREHFVAFPPSARKAILEWISLAKREETRSARVEETARLAAIGERANQWRKP